MRRKNNNQVGCIEYTLMNQKRFYTESDEHDWNDLVKKGNATKHPGWIKTCHTFM